MLKDKFFFSAANVLADSGAFDIYVAILTVIPALNETLGVVMKLDPNGDTVWANEYVAAPTETIAVNEEGFVASGHQNSIRKFSPTGTQIYSTGDANNSFQIAIDNNGFIYHSSGEPGNTRIFKWNLAGSTVAVYDDGLPIGVAIDKNGFVYTGGLDIDGFSAVTKLDSNLSFVWKYVDPFAVGTIRCIAVDKDGFIYGGDNYGVVTKLDPSGNFVWSFTGHTGAVNGIAVDKDGFIYTAGGIGDETTRKISSSGTQVWSFTGHTSRVLCVAVDPNGFVYSGCSDGFLRKIDPDGNQVDVYTFAYPVASVTGVAVSPGALTISQDL